MAMISEFLAIRDVKKITAIKTNNGHNNPFIQGMKLRMYPVNILQAPTPESRNRSIFSKKSMEIAMIVHKRMVKKNVPRYFLIIYMSSFFNPKVKYLSYP